MIIDANIYWLPDELFTDPVLQAKFIQAVNNGRDSKATVSTNADGSKKIVIEEPIGQSSLDYFQNDYLLEHQLQDMDEGRVDMAVLKLPGCQEWLDLDLCKVFNRAVAKHVQESKGRMVALATVPPYATAANLAELDYCIDELGQMGFNYQRIMRMVTWIVQPIENFSDMLQLRKSQSMSTIHQYQWNMVQSRTMRIYGAHMAVVRIR